MNVEALQKEVLGERALLSQAIAALERLARSRG
jgi:hypothetical protein